MLRQVGNHISAMPLNMNEDKEVPVREMTTYGGIEVYIHPLLTSALDGGVWSKHAHFSSHSTPYNTHHTGTGSNMDEGRTDISTLGTHYNFNMYNF